jgi:caa(3)-type oxidase subunit IV
MADAHSIDKQVRSYMWVFGALMVLTLITVAIAELHVPIHIGIAIGLLVATIKGTLVAGIFMHLFNEKKFIYWLLLLTAAFFVFLLFVPIMTASDKIGG